MGRQRSPAGWRRALHGLHADALLWKRLRRPASRFELGPPLRDHGSGRLFNSRSFEDNKHRDRPRYRRAGYRHRIQPACPQLGFFAPIQHALPDFVNRLIPIVEASMQTPVSNSFSSGTVTTGTINPGLIYVGDTYQVALEAMIPINRQSGSTVGIVGQLHMYLDDIFPKTLGRPIFADNINSGRPEFGR